MTKEEKIVQEAQKEERIHTFLLMKPSLESIRDDAREYVEKFANKYCVPKYVVHDYGTYEYTYEPHTDYDFDFKISETLKFVFTSHISLRTTGDVCYMISVKMLMNDDEEDPLSGCVDLHFGSLEKYIDAMKQACDKCYKKYVELHEHFKNRFF